MDKMLPVEGVKPLLDIQKGLHSTSRVKIFIAGDGLEPWRQPARNCQS